MTKFIYIDTGTRRYFINVNLINEVVITNTSIEFCFENNSKYFCDESYQIAKDAWLDYWKVSP